MLSLNRINLIMWKKKTNKKQTKISASKEFNLCMYVRTTQEKKTPIYDNSKAPQKHLQIYRKNA